MDREHTSHCCSCTGNAESNAESNHENKSQRDWQESENMGKFYKTQEFLKISVAIALFTLGLIGQKLLQNTPFAIANIKKWPDMGSGRKSTMPPSSREAIVYGIEKIS